MRLHRLAIDAFGPFAGHETVDFDALAGAGIFLLNGPTGAGKTSILDAISFALYGKVCGARQDPSADLRSHLADDDHLTRVSVEFSVRGRRLLVTREPRQTRPRRTGEGTTEHSPTAVLQELSGSEWTPLAANVREVTNTITDLIGLDADQFQQVILLPQGEFAQFLRAGPEERQALLQAVFDTGRFESIERWLHVESGNLRDALSGIDGELTASFNECAGALGVEPPDEPDRTMWLDEQLARLNELLAKATERDHQASIAVTAAAGLLAEEHGLASHQANYAEANNKRESLAEKFNELGRLEEQVRAARRASGARALHHQLQELTTSHKVTEEERRTAEQVLADLWPSLDGADDEELAKHEQQLSSLIDGLEQATNEEREVLPSLKLKSRGADDDVATAERHESELEASAKQLDDSLEADRAVAADGNDALSALPEATEREGIERSRAQAAADRHRLGLELSQASHDLDETNQQHRRAVAHRDAVFAQRIAGISAELASELVDDLPCPVCGSSEHPNPAKPTRDHATQEDLNHADRVAADLARTSAGLVERVTTLTERIQAITDAIGDQTLEEISASAAEASQRVTDLEQRRERGQEAEQRLDQAAKQHGEIETKLTDIRIQLPKLRYVAEHYATELRELEDRLANARQDFDTVADRSKNLSLQRQAITDVIRLRGVEKSGSNDLLQLQAALDDEAVRSGFPDADSAIAAMLEQDQLDTLANEVEDLNRAKAAIDAVLDNPDLIAASQRPPAAVATAEAALATANQAQRQTQQQLTAINAELAALGRCRTTAEGAAKRGGPIRERYELIRTLAALTRGEQRGAATGLKMRLSNFVLSARLAQVTDAASARLHAMTDGRYILRQTDATSHGGQQGGLGIEVFDAYSTRARGTRSLSGGESFAASLALALGLADVVAAESGGVSMETLFIDEGFGTLDEESLNSVLDILDGLRSGGRTVGVVSHVADMKERITTHLRVERIGRVSRIVQ